jgi:hypothetical protein
VFVPAWLFDSSDVVASLDEVGTMFKGATPLEPVLAHQNIPPMIARMMMPETI